MGLLVLVGACVSSTTVDKKFYIVKAHGETRAPVARLSDV